MSIQPRTHETVSEVQSTGPREDYIPIGTDTEGAHHVYRTTDESVHVIGDGERTVRYDLEGLHKSIDDWIDYIDARRDGFETQHLYKTLSGSLENTVEVGN
ncbi:hypothetical protein [Natrinema sp. SYSU A 869]|uniref:hypothetical protein n=1 Tax=Natrinema sp. SYSU A 869 TaxID=2871694 RepID=UPI001CA3ABBA|nr:hypothetical protein [Natrinema sp. SYSU A 869]